MLIAACVLLFVAQGRGWRARRISNEALNPTLLGRAFSWVFIAPLLLYALALLSHGSRGSSAGGKGTAYGARLALFWAFLAASPLPAARAGGRVHRAGAGFAGGRADLVWCFRLVLDIRAARGGMERMMTREAFWSLVRQTLFEPRDGGARADGDAVPQAVLWQALALLSVLYTIVYTISLRLSPPVETSDASCRRRFRRRWCSLCRSSGALALTVIALRAIGQALGGTGEIGDVLVLITWLQVLRLMVQVGVLMLALGSPPLAGMAIIVVAVWGLYIMINFVDAAHDFDNRFKAFGVIILSVVAMAIGLSAVLSLAASC